MKKIVSLLGIFALMLTGFTACNKVSEKETPSTGKHIIKVTPMMAETRTVMDEDGNTITVKWTDSDVALDSEGNGLFHVWENGVKGLTEATLNQDKTIATITCAFDENQSTNLVYSSCFAKELDTNGNPVVQAFQESGPSSFDPNADLLIGENITRDTQPDELLVNFSRPVALVKMTLKGLEAGESVHSVFITAKSGKLTGAYDRAQSAFDFTNGSESIVVCPENVTVGSDGTAPVYFVCAPIENEILEIQVWTSKGGATSMDEYEYQKEFTKEISFQANTLTRFTANVTGCEVKKYTKVTTEPADWSGTYLIVFEGATVNSNEVPAAAYNGGLENLDATPNGIAVTIANGQISGNSALDAAVFRIEAVDGGYSIQAVANTNYVGRESDNNGINIDPDPIVNSISLNADGNVDIVSGGAYMRYNANSDQKKFRYFKSVTYTGQKPVYLYLLEGSNTPDGRTEVTLTFDPANPTAITLGDSFTEPELTVDPAAAASSVVYSVETEPANCATIDANGKLTISAAGTITVTAAIPAGDDTYKPVSASYTLTVNAPVGHGQSADDPFTVAEVLSFVNGLTSTPTDDEYYVTGIVSRLASAGQFDANHGDATFFISDDGTEGNEFEAYRVLYLGNRKWKAGDMIIGVGDEVLVCGRLTKYNSQVETLAATGDNAYNGYLVSLEKVPYFTASVTSSAIEYTGGSSITLNIGANVSWTATINNGGSLKIGDANAATSVSGNSDTAVTVIIPQNTAGQTYTISFSTTSDQVTAPDDIQIIQTKQEVLYNVAFVAGTDITESNYGSLNYKRPISIEFDKGSANALTYYSPIRFYVGNKLTIGSPFSNVTIKRVIFELESGYTGAMSASAGTYSLSGLQGIWLGEVSELVLTGTTQTRFSSFTVYYALDGELPTLSSISIDEEPTKTEYTVGDAFDFSGAEVTATYSDNSTLDVSSLVTTDGATVVTSAGTNKTVTVSYTEGEITKTDSFSINVSESSGGTPKTSTLTFTAACGGSGTADDGVTWTVTSDGTESNFDSTRGIHYGTGSAQVKYIKLSTSGITGTIKSVVVNASTASGVSATVDVTVGGAAFGGAAQSLTSSAANYTFNGSASGEIVVTVTKPSKAAKALYVKSVVVTYE